MCCRRFTRNNVVIYLVEGYDKPFTRYSYYRFTHNNVVIYLVEGYDKPFTRIIVLLVIML